MSATSSLDNVPGEAELCTTPLGLTTIGSLGRWKSSAVLRYVEEALSQLPANVRAVNPSREGTKKYEAGSGQDPATPMGNGECGKEQKEAIVKEKVVQEKVVKFVKSNEAIIIPADPEEEDMWAISAHSRGRMAHVVTKASWGLDLDPLWVALRTRARQGTVNANAA